MTQEMEFQIFKFAPEDVLAKPYVASALQSIETAFLLASFNRWQSVIALLGGSCELLLRGVYGHRTSGDSKFIELIDMQKDEGNISADFAEQAHRMRQLRNDVMHKGLTPKDDIRCIESFLFDAMPYLKKILKKEYGVELWKLARSQEENATLNWIADVHRRTIQAVRLKKKRQGLNETSLRDCTFALQQVFRNIFWTGQNTPDIMPIYSFRESMLIELENKSGNDKYERLELQRDFILDYLDANDCEDSFVELDASCSICNSSFIATLDYDSGEFEINAIGCPGCGFKTKDADLCKTFCSVDLGPKDRKCIVENIKKWRQFEREEAERSAVWAALSSEERAARNKAAGEALEKLMFDLSINSVKEDEARYTEIDKDVFYE